jgi:NADPH-dependent curcumin reductase CurA
VTESTNRSKSRREFLTLSASAAAITALGARFSQAQASRPIEQHVWVIARPALDEEFKPDVLRWETRPLPALKENQLLVRTVYIGMEPSARNMLRLDDFSTPMQMKVGDVMPGGGVGVVEESKSPNYKKGDVVLAGTGWADYAVLDAAFVRPPRAGVPLETNMTVFNHIGIAAATGMLHVGNVQANDTVVVSSAAGATGSIAAQLAKGMGARVIGIAGGAEKCKYLTDDLGLDAAIDYKNEDVEASLNKLAPNGVTLFFDNVGGAIMDAVLMNLATNARIAICGQIALYNSGNRNDGQGVRNLMQLVFRTARMEGFLNPPAERRPEFEALFTRLINEGKLKTRTHIVQGLEKAPEAFNMLFTGANEGKLMVEVSPLA